jgi:ribonuclease R
MASLKKDLLTFLTSHDQPSTAKELCHRLKIRSRKGMSELVELLDALENKGILEVDSHGRYRYAGKKKREKDHQVRKKHVGIIRISRRGTGLVEVEGSEEQITVAPRFVHTAMHGDRVAVVPFARRKDRSANGDRAVEGEVVEVIERANTTIVGTLERRGHAFCVAPDNERIGRDIYVASIRAPHARPGDKVVVALAPWEDEHFNPEGTIIEVLGKAGEVHVEMLSVAREFNLPLSFQREVMHEAEALPAAISAGDLEGRLDLRQTPCFTIDPADAKDFDDAISFEPLNNGIFRLGVHIADVSHYVQEGSALDQEALKRGTSVYLVNEVIPMLPQRLSNDLCSLKPRVDRLCYSVVMDLNESGTVLQYEIRESVIHSARRFTYEECQEVLERRKDELAEILLPLGAMTKVLYKKRRKNGSLDFDTPEARFTFDSRGLPISLLLKERLDAHRLVEECMLLANQTVASHIGAVRKEEGANPFIYRVHDLPDPARLRDLARFVRQFGFSLHSTDGVPSKELQKLLDKAKGSEVEYLINEVALRSMAKAEYSEMNIGHYGLAFKYYTHFTSPIRRYPDLVVHRLLKEYRRRLSAKRREAIVHRLPFICRQASARERHAMEAERASVKIMQVEYMRRHLGDILDGVIGGVTEFGLFVEINDLLVEGLVHVRDMEDDYYMFDEKSFSLRGRSGGKVYRLGDRVKVRVVAVDPHEHRIDFMLVE